MDIIEFLEARISEDERCGAYGLYHGYLGTNNPNLNNRIVAECKAKRELIKAAPRYHMRNQDDPFYSCPQTQFEIFPNEEWHDGDYPGEASTPGSDLTDTECRCGLEYRRMVILRPLAMIYADHPNFEQSWRKVKS